MENLEITLENGKYRFYFKDDTWSTVYADRYGEPWRDFIGDKAVRALFVYALELKNKEFQNESE